MPLEIGDLTGLDPKKANKAKKKSRSKGIRKPKKGTKGNWRRLGTWWVCRKCEKEISSRDQSPIPVMICKECQKDADPNK